VLSMDLCSDTLYLTVFLLSQNFFGNKMDLVLPGNWSLTRGPIQGPGNTVGVPRGFQDVQTGLANVMKILL